MSNRGEPLNATRIEGRATLAFQPDHMESLPHASWEQRCASAPDLVSHAPWLFLQRGFAKLVAVLRKRSELNYRLSFSGRTAERIYEKNEGERFVGAPRMYLEFPELNDFLENIGEMRDITKFGPKSASPRLS